MGIMLYRYGGAGEEWPGRGDGPARATLIIMMSKTGKNNAYTSIYKKKPKMTMIIITYII